MLSKENRLKGSSNFKAIFKDGEKSFSSFFVVYRSPFTQEREPRIGLITSKKVGGAVERNRARRVLSEAIRKAFQKDDFDRVYVIKKELLEASFEDICSEVSKYW